MTNHIHFVAASEKGSLSNILRDFKSFTATKIMDAISKNIQERGAGAIYCAIG